MWLQARFTIIRKNSFDKKSRKVREDDAPGVRGANISLPLPLPLPLPLHLPLSFFRSMCRSLSFPSLSHTHTLKDGTRPAATPACDGHHCV